MFNLLTIALLTEKTLLAWKLARITRIFNKTVVVLMYI